MLKRAYLNHLVFLLIFIVFGLSLRLFGIDPNLLPVYAFSGYFILGFTFGLISRNSFLGGLVIIFPLTFLSWLIAFALSSSSGGITALVQAFSENLQDVLVAGLLFSSVASVPVFVTYGFRAVSDIMEGRRGKGDQD
jgi:energy-converting hydrogenase Eha subunit C